jgi:DNA transposition AAA+ family ATPase
MQKEQLDRLRVALMEEINRLKADGNEGVVNKLAGLIGISASYISHIKSGNYFEIPTGNGRTTTLSDAIYKKIATYLKLDDKVWDIYNYTLFFNAAIESKKNYEQIVVDGPKGSGKTFAGEAFKKQYPNNTYLVTASDDMSAKAFLLTLAKEMGIVISGSNRVIRQAIEAKVMGQKNTLIIIDEAENLKTSSYGAIKAIYDAVHKYAGMILMGANDYSDWLRKQASKNKTPFTQLWSRFSSNTVMLSTMTKDDVVMVCKLNGIVESGCFTVV